MQKCWGGMKLGVFLDQSGGSGARTEWSTSTRRVSRRAADVEPDGGPQRPWGGVWVLF